MLTAETHILWLDWTTFRIVCPTCHSPLLPWQWTGRSGEEWTQTQKAEVRLVARLWQQCAAQCECCGLPFPPRQIPLRLRSAAEVLVRYRRGQREFRQIEMVGGDLSALELDGSLMPDANFNGTRLVGTGMRESVLTGASLVGTDFASARLCAADLSGADLVGANLSGSDLKQAKLIGGDLRGASLRWANLEGAQLRGALLDESSLRGARLRGAVLPDGTMGK